MLIKCTPAAFEEEMVKLMIESWLLVDSTNITEEDMIFFRKEQEIVISDWLSPVLLGLKDKALVLQEHIPLNQIITEMDIDIPTDWLEPPLNDDDWKIVIDHIFGILLEWLRKKETIINIPWFVNE